MEVVFKEFSHCSVSCDLSRHTPQLSNDPSPCPASTIKLTALQYAGSFLQKTVPYCSINCDIRASETLSHFSTSHKNTLWFFLTPLLTQHLMPFISDLLFNSMFNNIQTFLYFDSYMKHSFSRLFDVCISLLCCKSRFIFHAQGCS